MGGNNASEKSLRDVVLNFVIAGRDTTATTLSWAIYMVMTHSHVAEKLYFELKTFEENQAKEENVTLSQCDKDEPGLFNERVEQFSKLLNKDSLERLHYLHAVITETLRLYPAVPQVCIFSFLHFFGACWCYENSTKVRVLVRREIFATNSPTHSFLFSTVLG